MMNEKIRKKYWLEHLANQDKNWVDGDIKKDKTLKTADFVNHNLHIAIELKIEEGQDYWFLKFSSNKVFPYLKSADNKFKNYPNYKTILFIESNCTVGDFQFSASQIFQYKNSSLFIKNKRDASRSLNNIGSIILWPYSKDVVTGYGYGWEYNKADADRKINLESMKSLLKIDIQHYLDGPIKNLYPSGSTEISRIKDR